MTPKEYRWRVLLIGASDQALQALRDALAGDSFQIRQRSATTNMDAGEIGDCHAAVVEIGGRADPMVSAPREWKRRNPRLVVFAVVPGTDIELAVECLQHGFDGCLATPLDAGAVRATMRNSLSQALSAQDKPSTYGRRRRGAPQMIHGYEVVSIVGRGAKGSVFLVRQTRMGKVAEYAMKVLNFSGIPPLERREAIARFENEAKLTMQVKHKNIVDLIGYNVDIANNMGFIVMEYIRGQPLTRIIANHEQWSYHEKAWLLRQIADGLGAIHAHGICHRDIKPANILVDGTNTVTITDFGIAHFPDANLTMTGDYLGTPTYSAPEAFSTAKVDRRADFFSLGVLGYELLVGTHPFPNVGIANLEYNIRIGLPMEPRKRRRDFPWPLQTILARLLKKHPKDRYSSAKEIMEALDSYLHAAGAVATKGEAEDARGRQTDWS